MSGPEAIEAGLLETLRQILPTNGYETDLGARVFVGHTYTDSDPAPLMVVGDFDDEYLGRVGAGVRKGEVTFPFEVWVDGVGAASRPLVHQLLRDLKRAFARPTSALLRATQGADGRPTLHVRADPQPGSQLTLIEASYTAGYQEQLG
ncbi:hypothetical protein [Chitinimonas koreensis]|uniref:hypothetical protein n=1 Tax=Chitinimonas koreensis TaxID=356302 RepID=UPI0004226B6A|nr:hypothetical protein [Chitinimonas koreensis]QNM94902.1 hypothetical protein H9L41_13320 [Chitinimonas koreensis]